MVVKLFDAKMIHVGSETTHSLMNIKFCLQMEKTWEGGCRSEDITILSAYRNLVIGSSSRMTGNYHSDFMRE